MKNSTLAHALTAAAVAFLGTGLPPAQAGSLPAAPSTWTTEVQRGHPLVGRLWNVRGSRDAEPPELAEAAASARFVLLGETHDNPDHHRLQAWIVEAMLAQGSRPAVVFEMIRADQSEALRAHLESAPRDAQGLGPAVTWEERGWPDWPMYLPIAELALNAGLSVRAGDVARSKQDFVAREGFEALETADREALALDRPLGESERQALETQLLEGHCGMIPETAIPAMVRVQRLRDAVMADSLIDGAEAAGSAQAVLIAGREHVRADRGVPWYLRARRESPDVLSIGLMQVSEGRDTVEAYLPDVGGDEGPPVFDYLWFTPRPHDRDPCEEMRRQMEEHRAE